MTTEEARLRAEKLFKQEERERDGRAAMMEYEAHAHHTRANMARLRALRLARDADTEAVGSGAESEPRT